jgi:ubiquinone/menaquinone biosynthesis C-methylase UbiE/choline kinase
MKAIILAAGKPSFGENPICNTLVQGVCLLDIQVSCLQKLGFKQIVLVAGYKYLEIQRADIEIRYNKEWEQSGCLSSLRSVGDLFDGKDDTLIMYGDTIFEPFIIHELINSKSNLTANCFIDRSGKDLSIFREFAIIENDLIKKIVPIPEHDGLRTVFCGSIFLKKTKTGLIKKHLNINSDNVSGNLGDLLNQIIGNGVDVTPVITDKGWCEIRTLEKYKNALDDIPFIKSIIQHHTDWTERARKYDKLDWVNNDALLFTIAGLVDQNATKSVLDIGVGTGKVLSAIKSVLENGEFWGVDSSSAMLDRIRGKDDFKLVCENAEVLREIPNDYFDLVTARMVFHHIQNPEKAVNSINRVMKKEGAFILCEGTPPTVRTIEWYREMFRYKEDRKTITEMDIIEYLINGGFADIKTHTVVMRNCSLNNWLDNSGVDQKNIDIIKQMHFEAPEYVKKDYNMRFKDGDCFMTWKFAVTKGIKKAIG